MTFKSYHFSTKFILFFLTVARQNDVCRGWKVCYFHAFTFRFRRFKVDCNITITRPICTITIIRNYKTNQISQRRSETDVVRAAFALFNRVEYLVVARH